MFRCILSVITDVVLMFSMLKQIPHPTQSSASPSSQVPSSLPLGSPNHHSLFQNCVVFKDIPDTFISGTYWCQGYSAYVSQCAVNSQSWQVTDGLYTNLPSKQHTSTEVLHPDNNILLLDYYTKKCRLLGAILWPWL